MQAEGHGAPPCRYAVLVLGSGGRGESLLAPDQDNAVVFAHGEPDGREDRWFKTLGEKLADILDVAGVPYCKGGVMARNAAFRGSLETWKNRVEEWVRRSRPDDLLNVDIVYDMKPVHGDLALSDALFDHAYARGHAEPVFAKLLGEQIVAGNPFTFLGGLQLDDGRLDIKMHGLFPIVAAARTLAIRHGIRALSTRDRLEGLIALDVGGDTGHEDDAGRPCVSDRAAAWPANSRHLRRHPRVQPRRSGGNPTRAAKPAEDADQAPSVRAGAGAGSDVRLRQRQTQDESRSSSTIAARSANSSRSSCALRMFILRKLKM